MLGQSFRYGLTAGVNPSGYNADRINDHHDVFSPEAVAAWGDIATAVVFHNAQASICDPRYRYGAVRVSSQDSTWIPHDTGFVDHLFLLFGFVESSHPGFFRCRNVPMLPGWGMPVLVGLITAMSVVAIRRIRRYKRNTSIEHRSQ